MIALDHCGASWSTERLATKLDVWLTQGQDVCWLIGGPEGFSKEVLTMADQCWSLSALTYPHPIVRIIVLEQLYRAWTIHSGHPYHK